MKFFFFICLNNLKNDKFGVTNSKTWETPASTYLSRISIRTQIAHVEVWLYTHVHKHLPFDVKVTKFLTSGLPESIRTWGLVLIMFSTWKWEKTVFSWSPLFYFEWEKTALSIQRKKMISCSLDPTTNSETRKLKIQDFLVLQVFRLGKTKDLRQKIQFPSKNQKDLSSLWSITFRRHCTVYQLYARQSTAMWCHIDRNHDYKTNVNSSLPVWSTSSVQVVEKFDCWTPSIRIWVSRTNSHRWKGQFFYGISQCLEYCNNWAVIPC